MPPRLTWGQFHFQQLLFDQSLVVDDPLLTVAICTHNRGAVLGNAAESVIRQIDDDTELLIVDNASSDNTVHVAQTLAAAHRCVRLVTEPRLGLSHGRNTALAEARSRYVVFLDDDAVVEPNWLAGYRRFFETPPAPNIAAAGSVVTPRYDGSPPRWLSPTENALSGWVAPGEMTGRSLPWGCNFACHRALALSMGGFDTQLGRHGAKMGAHEETDLFHRLRAAGYSVWWLPDAPIRHDIDSYRLTVRFHCYSALAAGRSTVALRLRKRPGRWQQCGFLAGRLLTTPILGPLYLGLALITAPFRQGQIAVNALAVAARNAGILWQLLVKTPDILAGTSALPSNRLAAAPVRQPAAPLGTPRECRRTGGGSATFESSRS